MLQDILKVFPVKVTWKEIMCSLTHIYRVHKITFYQMIPISDSQRKTTTLTYFSEAYMYFVLLLITDSMLRYCEDIVEQFSYNWLYSQKYVVFKYNRIMKYKM